MSFFLYLKKERNKVLLSALSSGLGFFLALMANSTIERYREYGAYQVMLTGVRVEAEANAHILQTGFNAYFEEGIVLQQFSTTIASQSLSSITFLKFSTGGEATKIAEYMREVALANRYAEMVGEIRKGEGNEEFANHIVKSWRENLARCKKSIEQVQTLH